MGSGGAIGNWLHGDMPLDSSSWGCALANPRRTVDGGRRAKDGEANTERHDAWLLDLLIKDLVAMRRSMIWYELDENKILIYYSVMAF